MQVAALAQAILGFVAIVCVGVLLRMTGLVERGGARVLNRVIIYVGLPAFVFIKVHGADIGAEMLSAVGIAWMVFGAVFAVSAGFARLLRLDRRRAGGFMLASTLGNTGYIGYPLTESLLGSAAVAIAVFYDVFGTVMQLVLAGFPLSRRMGTRASETNRFGLLGELATFPALVAAVIALSLARVGVPTPVSDWLELLASMVAPLIMLSVGISLSPRAIGRSGAALAVLAVIKLIAAPAIAAALGTMILSDTTALRALVLEAGTPSMMLTFVIGERFGLDEEFIAAAIFVTTALSAITIPVAQLLLR